MLSLEFRGIPGSSSEDVAVDLVRFAATLNVIAELKFNEVLMWAYPGESFTEVLERFEQDCERHYKKK